EQPGNATGSLTPGSGDAPAGRRGTAGREARGPAAGAARAPGRGRATRRPAAGAPGAPGSSRAAEWGAVERWPGAAAQRRSEPHGLLPAALVRCTVVVLQAELWGREQERGLGRLHALDDAEWRRGQSQWWRRRWPTSLIPRLKPGLALLQRSDGRAHSSEWEPDEDLSLA